MIESDCTGHEIPSNLDCANVVTKWQAEDAADEVFVTSATKYVFKIFQSRVTKPCQITALGKTLAATGNACTTVCSVNATSANMHGCDMT